GERARDRLRRPQPCFRLDGRVEDERAKPRLLEDRRDPSELFADLCQRALLARQSEERARVALREPAVHDVAPAPETKSRTKRCWSSGCRARRMSAVACRTASSIVSLRSVWRAAATSCS